MFARTLSLTERPLLIVGLAGLAIFATRAVPAAAQGVTPERALLNAVPAAYRVVSDIETAAVDGEQALLGHSASGGHDVPSLATQSEVESPAVDGDRALRAIVVHSTKRRLTLAW
jgi:hypothetical protein